MRVSFITRELGQGMRRNFTMTLALIISVAVSLALLGSALLVKTQVERMKGYWYDKIEVSVYLCGENSTAINCKGPFTEAQRLNVQSILQSMTPTVQKIYFESSDEAFTHFKQQFKGTAIVSSVGADALPASFRVKLDDPAYSSWFIKFSGFSNTPYPGGQGKAQNNSYHVPACDWCA